MKKELRDKWLADLRTNGARQTQGQLWDPKEDGFCCLGRLCVVAGAKWETEQEMEAENGEVWMRELEKPICQWTADGDLLNAESAEELFGLPLNCQHTLANMNDGRKRDEQRFLVYCEPKTFAEIADWIEVNVPSEDEGVDPEVAA